jgi:hypothetical protein
MVRPARSPLIVLIMTLSICGAVAAQQRNATKPDARPRTSSISGRVTIGGKPAANAKIVITEIKEPNGFGAGDFHISVDRLGEGEAYDTLTDADGRYSAPNLPEGKYLVHAMLKNCVRESAELKGTQIAGLGELIPLGEGEIRANADFALTRGGVITGRVTDPDGRPLIARVVSLQSIDEKGQKQEYPNQLEWESRQTDDRGVYRVYALRPGRYLVSAGGESDSGFAIGGAGSYPRTWSPDTSDEKRAKVIDVTEGGEVTGVDIRLGVAKKTYEALGRVIDEETGKPIAAAGLMCVRTRGEDGAAGAFGGNVKTDDLGNFRFNGLTSGQYQIGFMDYESFVTGKGNDFYGDGITFEVGAADVSGLEIKTKRGATISGAAVIEDADPAAKPNLPQTMILATSAPLSRDDVDETKFMFGSMPVFARVGADGGFMMKGLRPGKVTFDSQEMTRRVLQIVRVERDGADVSEGIVVAGGENISGVRIVLAKGSGVIRGQVQITGGALPEGWRMTVMARNEKAAEGQGGSAEVDSKGRFAIDSLLPGEYVLRLTAMPARRAAAAQPIQPPAPVEQKVSLAKGQEVQVSLTLDLSKKVQEEKQ